MFRTFNLITQVPADHELRIKLPSDVPAGPVDIVMVVSSRNKPALKQTKAATRKAFGMWKDRVASGTLANFARELRQTAWSRRS